MDFLTDTSWTLHRIIPNTNTTTTTTYNQLFTPSTTQAQITHHFNHLPTFLSSQSQYTDDLDDRNEKLGHLREVKHAISRFPPPNSRQRFVRVQLVYQSTTFSFVLYGPSLLLSKAPVSHTTQFTAFLSETCGVEIALLRLPCELLCAVLRGYISHITHTHTTPNDDGDDGDDGEDEDFLRAERRAALIRTAIGTLRLTISFAGSVRAHLRTLEVGVPWETVEVLTSNPPSEDFAAGLAKYVHLQTGLKLPMTVTGKEGDELGLDGRAGSVGSELVSGLVGEPPLKLSKMTCAAFAISVDGRLKFTGKAVDGAAEQDDIVSMANAGILQAIVDEAQKTDD